MENVRDKISDGTLINFIFNITLYLWTVQHTLGVLFDNKVIALKELTFALFHVKHILYEICAFIRSVFCLFIRFPFDGSKLNLKRINDKTKTGKLGSVFVN